MSTSGESSTSIRKQIDDKRADKIKKWNDAYNTIRSEIKDLIASFDDIMGVPNATFQDLTLKFYSIHLCNFFYFHVREALVSRLSNCKCDELVMNGFSNESNTPTIPVMSNLLSYLIDDEKQLEDLVDSYKLLYEIRNKYAHGASGETSYSITCDQYKKTVEDIVKKIAI